MANMCEQKTELDGRFNPSCIITHQLVATAVTALPFVGPRLCIIRTTRRTPTHSLLETRPLNSFWTSIIREYTLTTVNWWSQGISRSHLLGARQYCTVASWTNFPFRSIVGLGAILDLDSKSARVPKPGRLRARQRGHQRTSPAPHCWF